MALAQRRNGIQASIWPGFVDAMTALLLVLMFVLTIFMVVQAVLRETITGQENELNELGAEFGALATALGLATSQRDDLRLELGSLRATLSQAEDDIDARDARIRDFEARVAALLVQQSETQARITSLQGENVQILSEKEALDLALAVARDEISAGEQAARLAAARREALEAAGRRGEAAPGEVPRARHRALVPRVQRGRRPPAAVLRHEPRHPDPFESDAGHEGERIAESTYPLQNSWDHSDCAAI